MSTGLKRHINFTLALLLLTLSPLFSQVLTRKQFIKAVQDADISFYYDENYEKAATQGNKGAINYLIKLCSTGTAHIPPNKDKEMYWQTCVCGQ